MNTNKEKEKGKKESSGEKNIVIIYSSPVEKSLFKVLVIATGFLQRHCPALLFQEGQYAAGRWLSS